VSAITRLVRFGNSYIRLAKGGARLAGGRGMSAAGSYGFTRDGGRFSDHCGGFLDREPADSRDSSQQKIEIEALDLHWNGVTIREIARQLERNKIMIRPFLGSYTKYRKLFPHRGKGRRSAYRRPAAMGQVLKLAWQRLGALEERVCSHSNDITTSSEARKSTA
jgi:hypothetical protein